MKSSTVRGTPVHSMRGSEGMAAGKPKGMSGTVNQSFEGDQKGNHQEGIATGTPYQSHDGNSANARRTVSQGKYGMVTDQNGDQASHLNNGNGVILDGMSRENGYFPPGDQTTDSPVPGNAPTFDSRGIRQENLAHLGRGNERAVGDVIADVGGVMSRGIENNG